MKNRNRITAVILVFLFIASLVPGALAAEVISPGKREEGSASGAQTNPGAADALKTSGEKSYSAVLSASTDKAAGTGGTYYIRSLDDLRKLAESCGMDSFSKGIKVILTKDLDLSGDPYFSIPIFSGSFDGGGYKIKGLKIFSEACHAGLFRYLAEGGSIRNLSVEADVELGGKGEHVGGIVGNNFGEISACSFSGSVEGKDSIGGIAGTNEKSGVIDSCRSYGFVDGDNFAGGIVGQNMGLVKDCLNSAEVNTRPRETEGLSVADIDLKALDQGAEAIEKKLSALSAGGVAGFSNGIILTSNNMGTVGRDRIGENVGGIAGRESGYIFKCKNSGSVRGNSDIGGIVGQMEPYLESDMDAGSAENLSRELEVLHRLIDTALNNAGAGADIVTRNLSAMSTYMMRASDDLSYISKNTVEFVDEAVQNVNEILNRVDYAMDALPSVADDAEAAAQEFEKAMQEMTGLNEALDIIGKMEHSIYNETDHAILTLTFGTGGKLSSANMNPAAGITVPITIEYDTGYELDRIEIVDADGNNVPYTLNAGKTECSFIMPAKEGDPVNDPMHAVAKNTVVRVSFRPSAAYPHSVQIKTGWGGIVIADNPNPAEGDLVTLNVVYFDGYTMDLDSIRLRDINGNALEITKETDSATKFTFTMPAGGKALFEADFIRKNNWFVVTSAQADLNMRAQSIKNTMIHMDEDLVELMELLGLEKDENGRWYLPPGSKFPPRLNKSEKNRLAELVANIAQSGAYAAADLALAVNDLNNILKVTGKFAAEVAQEANAQMKTIIEHLQSASNSLTMSIQKMKNILNHLNGLEDVQFPTLDTEYRQRMDSLFANFRSSMQSMNAASNEMNNASRVLVGDLKAINNQMNKVLIMLVDAVNNISNRGLGSRCTDVPDEDINSTEGKIRQSENSGTVSGDRNVGGIAGNMDVEYEYDPRFLMGDGNLLGQRYYARCYIRSCRNFGIIKAKKDCVGAIAGYMGMGYVLESAGFGSVESEGGSFVGGIAGKSVSNIENCFSMCSLSGQSRVGGIAGCGTNVKNSHSFVDILNGTSFKGAILGEQNAEKEGAVSGNSFVSESLQGIDSISYQGKAEPISYEELKRLPGIPDEFTNLKISFIADGTVVKTLSFEYGGSIADSEVPQVPAKEGFTGKWKDFKTENLRFSNIVEAEYVATNSTIASSNLREDGKKPVVLIEGDFVPGASIAVENIPELTLPEKTPGERVEAIRVSVSGGADTFAVRKLRYLPPETGLERGKLQIYVRENGEWQEKNYEKSGRYAVVEVKGDDIEIASRQTLGAGNTIILAAGGAGIAAVAAAIVLIGRNKRKKRKELRLGKAKSEQ